MISVTVAAGETVVTLESESTYNPDIMDDLCRRAASTLLATLQHLLASVEADDEDDDDG